MANIGFWAGKQTGASVSQSNYSRWDQLSLGGILFPGIAQVEPETEYAFEELNFKTPESSINDPTYRSALFFRGHKPAKIAANILIWEALDWQNFQAQFKQFVPNKAGVLTPYVIQHPSCELLKIVRVAVVAVGIPQIVDGTIAIRMRMVQWFPPVKLPIPSKFANVGSNAVPPSGTSDSVGR